MSTVEPLNYLPATPRSNPVVAFWRKVTTGRSPWGLSDQILISGTNFVTMVFAGRGLGKAAWSIRCRCRCFPC